MELPIKVNKNLEKTSLMELIKQKEGRQLMVAILSELRWARSNNFEIFSPEDYIELGGKIAKDYPDMKPERLHQIIQRGIRGEYDNPEYQMPPINLTTVYRWINKALGTGAKGIYV